MSGSLPGISMRGVCMDYPLPARSSDKNGPSTEFAAVGGRLTEFRGQRFVRALDDITIEIGDGERLALLGGNGSGKSTLLKVMGGLLPIAKGRMKTSGRVTTLFNTTVGMDVNLSGFDNLERLAALHSLPRSYAAQIRDDVAEFTELGGFLKLPVRTYSAGMRARLGFAFATSIPSGILLIDEVIGVGDASFSQRARDRLVDRMHNSGIVVLASHSIGLLRNFCNRGLVLQHGQVKFVGDIEEAISEYQSSVRRNTTSRTTIPTVETGSSTDASAEVAPSYPVAIEKKVRARQRFELFVTSTKVRGSAIKQHLAARASLAAFQFFDEVGRPIRRNYDGFMQGSNELNFTYVQGGWRPGASRHVRFAFRIPNEVHSFSIALQPAADRNQSFTRFELNEVASEAALDAELRPGRDVGIDAVLTSLRQRDWSVAAIRLEEVLAWPTGDVSTADVLRLEQALAMLPSSEAAHTLSMLESLLSRASLPRSSLTDRVATTYYWELLQQDALTGNADYLIELRKSAAKLASRLGVFSAPLLGEGAIAMKQDDRATAYARFREAAGVEAFNAPLAQRFAGAYCLRAYDELVSWGERALAASQYPPLSSPEVEWLDLQQTTSNAPWLLLAADAGSFLAYAPKVLRKLERLKSRCDVHFHVVNWNGECSKLRAELFASTERQLGFSAEAHSGRHDRLYAQVAPYLRAREVHERLNAPLVISEIDREIDFDPASLVAALGDGDIGLRTRNSGVRLPWAAQSSYPLVIGSSHTSRIFLRMLESYVHAFYGDEYFLTRPFSQLAINEILYLMKLNDVEPNMINLHGLTVLAP